MIQKEYINDKQWGIGLVWGAFSARVGLRCFRDLETIL